MRQSLIAAVTLVYIAISSAVSFVAAQETVVARRAFEDSKSQHQSEVRRLALDAIGQIMPSLTRFAERQDSENLNKYIKMLALFSKSVDYPARLIPSPSVAKQFSNKRKESARKVYEAYKAAGGIPLDQPSNDPRLVELQSEIKKFIEQERMLQSLVDSPEVTSESPDMAEAEVPPAKAEQDDRVPKNETSNEKGAKATFEIFKAYEELAEEINQELIKQKTSVLRQKALDNAQKRISDFWNNKQLSFDCEVVDLASTGKGYELTFQYVGDSDEQVLLPNKLTTKVYVQSLDIKIEEVQPGREFTLNVSVSPEFYASYVRETTLVSLPFPSIAGQTQHLYNLEIRRINISWQK